MQGATSSAFTAGQKDWSPRQVLPVLPGPRIPYQHRAHERLAGACCGNEESKVFRGCAPSRRQVRNEHGSLLLPVGSSAERRGVSVGVDKSLCGINHMRVFNRSPNTRSPRGPAPQRWGHSNRGTYRLEQKPVYNSTSIHTDRSYKRWISVHTWQQTAEERQAVQKAQRCLFAEQNPTPGDTHRTWTSDQEAAQGLSPLYSGSCRTDT